MTPDSKDAACVSPGWAPRTFEQRIQLADLWLKGISALLVLVGGGFGAYKYLDDRREHEAAQQELEKNREARLKEELLQREKEYKFRLFDQKTQLYAALCDAAAKVATCRSLHEASEEHRLFETLYWGKLCIFESQEVEKAEVQFHQEIMRILESDGEPTTELKNRSLALAKACREDLSKDLEMDVGALLGARMAPTTSVLPTTKTPPAGTSKVVPAKLLP